MTNLGDPGVHNLVDVLARGLGKRVPQSLGLGVAVFVSLEVVGDALEESLYAEVVGNHANGGAALEVADMVKDLVDVEGIADGDVDRVTGADAIQAESVLHALVDKLGPNLPVGVQMVHSVPSDPGSEAFVEPQLIPPVHGDQVAEPLVSKLVGDNVGDGVLESSIRSLLVKEDLSSTVGNETPVLHGAVSELVDGEQVRLGKRVVNVENLREKVDDLRGVLQSPATLLLETTGGVDTDGNLLSVVLAVGQLLDVLKITDSPGQKVAAHDGRRLEGNQLPALLGGLGVLDGHVAQGDLVGGDLNLQVVSGLEVGLVEAGESSAGIASLELGAEHVVPLVVAGDRGSRGFGRLVLAAVETGHLVVDDALELDDERGLLGNGELIVKGDGGALGLGVVGDVGRLP